MKTHDLKTWPEYYIKVLFDDKQFELRKNDRDFKTGDILILREWHQERGYTGNKLRRKVGYILDKHEGLKEGFVIMQLLAV